MCFLATNFDRFFKVRNLTAIKIRRGFFDISQTRHFVASRLTALAAIEFELVVEICTQIYATVAVYAADFFKELKPVFFVLV